MINVYDFCDACAEAKMIKLSFFDADSDSFITSMTLHDVKVGVKTLSAVCRFSQIECIYISSNVLCAKVRVHASDM